jgi:hypothetical protein
MRHVTDHQQCHDGGLDFGWRLVVIAQLPMLMCFGVRRHIECLLIRWCQFDRRMVEDLIVIVIAVRSNTGSVMVGLVGWLVGWVD